MSGIEESRIKNIDILQLIRDSVTCKICQLICDFPMYCGECEISFCKNCIKKDDKAALVCFLCKKNLLKEFPQIFQTFYNSLEIKCKQPYCNQTLSYDSLHEHEDICKNNSNQNESLICSSYIFINDDSCISESLNPKSLSKVKEIKKSETNLINNTSEKNDENKDKIVIYQKKIEEKVLNDKVNQSPCLNEIDDENENNDNSISFITNKDFSYINYTNIIQEEAVNEEINNNPKKDNKDYNNDYELMSNNFLETGILNIAETENKKFSSDFIENKIFSLERTLDAVYKELNTLKAALKINDQNDKNNFIQAHELVDKCDVQPTAGNSLVPSTEHKIIITHNSNNSALSYRNKNNKPNSNQDSPNNFNIINSNKAPYKVLSSFVKKCQKCSSLIQGDSYRNCIFCLKTVCQSCIISCLVCNQNLCMDCGKCSLCKSAKYCLKERKSCNQCQNNYNCFCADCIRVCGKCAREYCKICCGFKCKDNLCKLDLCINCCWNCKVCYNTYCDKNSNIICKLCGVKACENKCNENCTLCLKKFCLNCIIKCEKCKNTMCKSCSAKNYKNKAYSYLCKCCL